MKLLMEIWEFALLILNNNQKISNTDNINRILITINELFHYYFGQWDWDFVKLITLTE